MKKLVLLFFAVSTSLLLASPAMTVNVEQTGTGNPTDIATIPGIGGVYIGPYELSINGNTPVDALCIDPLHESNVGNTWTAYVSTVGGDISKTYNASNSGKFLSYSLTSTQGYEADAVLFSLIEGPGNNLADRITLQEAAWTIFDPTLFGPETSAIQQGALDIAEANGFPDALDSFNFSRYQILTDVAGSSQEFMVASAAPEPLSLGLMGFGLIGIAAFGLLRRRKQAAATQV